MRCAILPYPSDPFLLKYWIDNFKKVWYDEVDRVYVIQNGSIESNVIEYIKELSNDPKIDLTLVDHQIQHGDAIKIGLEKCSEEYVMLIEDDAYILKSGFVDLCFKRIESGEWQIVASKRGSCSFEILETAQKKWGLDYTGFGDQGCNFFPCFYFSKVELLLSTDRDFNSRAWVKGETVEPLNYEVEVAVVASDTFVSTSLQLRDKVPEEYIFYVPQYHASTDDVKDYQRLTNIFDGKAPWVHLGSLSSGISGALMDDQGRSLARRTVEEPKGGGVLPPSWCDTNSEPQQLEWERRVMMWMIFWENREIGKIDYFADLYKQAIDRIITQFKLNKKRILQRREAYRTIGL